MKKRSVFLGCFALIFAGLAFSTTPSFAQKKTVKACQEEWRANKAANEAAKITKKTTLRNAEPTLQSPRPLRQLCAGGGTETGGKKASRPQAGRIRSRASLWFGVEGRKGSRESAGGDDFGRSIGATATSAKKPPECEPVLPGGPAADDCRIDNPIRWPVVMLGGGNETARFHHAIRRGSSCLRHEWSPPEGLIPPSPYRSNAARMIFLQL